MMKKYAHKCLAVLIAVALVLSVAPTALAVDASLEEKPLTEDELAAIQSTNEAVEGYINSLYAETVLRKPLYKSVSLNVILEQQDNDHYCGPASAIMVARYLKIVNSDFDQPQMAKVIGITSDGSSSAGITNGLNNLLKQAGKTQQYQVASMDTADFNRSIMYTLDADYPMIFSVKKMPLYTSKSGHFIVIKGYKTDKSGDYIVEYVTINDCHWNDDYYGEHTYTYELMATACSSNGSKFIRLK